MNDSDFLPVKDIVHDQEVDVKHFLHTVETYWVPFANQGEGGKVLSFKGNFPYFATVYKVSLGSDTFHAGRSCEDACRVYLEGAATADLELQASYMYPLHERLRNCADRWIRYASTASLDGSFIKDLCYVRHQFRVRVCHNGPYTTDSSADPVTVYQSTRPEGAVHCYNSLKERNPTVDLALWRF